MLISISIRNNIRNSEKSCMLCTVRFFFLLAQRFCKNLKPSSVTNTSKLCCVYTQPFNRSGYYNGDHYWLCLIMCGFFFFVVSSFNHNSIKFGENSFDWWFLDMFKLVSLFDLFTILKIESISQSRKWKPSPFIMELSLNIF